MKLSTALSTSLSMLVTGMRLMLVRPYLFLYMVIPVLTPLVLVLVAEYHRMFDLYLYYRPVMQLVVYILAGMQAVCAVYLSRRVIYLLDKKTEIRSDRFFLFFNACVWMAIVVGGMFALAYIMQRLQFYVRNPIIINYTEPIPIIMSRVMPLAVTILALSWYCMVFVAPALAVERGTWVTALWFSCMFAYKHIVQFILLASIFFVLDMIPFSFIYLIPRYYIMLKQIVPYCVQLSITTLAVTTYAVFYARYRPTEK